MMARSVGKEVEVLVLTRKVNEKIAIAGGIEVTVLKIEGAQVRLGLQAPSHVRILREEIVGKSDHKSAKSSLLTARN
jgi:carbon storage regulator